MPAAVGVVHLGDDVAQHAVGVVAPVQAQRVEHVAEHPGLQQRGDPCRRAGRCRARRGRRRRVAAVCRSAAPSKVVAGVEPGERPQPARQLRQLVDVDVPAVAAVFEVVVHRSAAQVRDPGPVQRRGQHGTASASARGRRPVGAEAAGRSQTRRGAVLVEAPAVVRAGEHHPVIVQRRQKSLRGNRFRGVHRVAVGHLGQHGRRVDVVAAAECDQEPARARRAASGG